MAETNNIIYKIEVDTQSGKVSIDGITKGFEQADKSFDKLRKNVNKGLGNLNKSLDGTSKATGGATASVMELGRVISDAPYGIRGMANNLTQLVSQIGFTTKSAGGFTNAMKEMWKALMGPLGIVLAITTAISALDYFKGAQKKVKEEADSLNEVFGEEATKLMILKRVLDDSNVSLKDKRELVKLANKDIEGLNAQLDENGNLTEDSAKHMDEYSASLIRNAKARAIAKLIQEEMNKQMKIEARAIGDSLSWYEKAYLNIKSQILGVSSAVNTGLEMDREDRESELEESISLVDRYIGMLKDKDAEAAKELFKDTKKARKSGKAKIMQTPEEFRTDAVSLQSEVDAWDKKMLMAATKNKDQRLQLELIFYKKKQELRRQDRIDEAYNELFKYEDKIDKLVKAGKMEKKAAEDAKSAALITAQEKVDKINQEQDRLIKKAEEVTKALRLSNAEEDEKDIMSFKEKINIALEAYLKFHSGVTNFMNGEFDRQVTIEQNKTNALNNELNKRLLNENLSKEERKRIQLEIGANDEKLRKTQEKIEKKRFKLNKAANIAQATISTYLAATRVLAETKGGTLARFAGMFATISTGLLQVAAIARTKFQSSAGSGGQIGGGFGGSGGGRDRSFNFNLAGASRENQLANTLQGRFDQPLQAYVVSRDITNSQQLDEDIRNNASFG